MMQSLLTRLVFQKLIFWLSTHTSFVLFVHCSPLFAVAPDFLHQLNGGLWFHGNFHLHLNFKSSSTNLCVADKGKAETICVTFCLPHDMIFFHLLKHIKTFQLLIVHKNRTLRLSGTQVCVVTGSRHLVDLRPNWWVQWEERMWQLHGMCLDVRVCRDSDAPTSS